MPKYYTKNETLELIAQESVTMLSILKEPNCAQKTEDISNQIAALEELHDLYRHYSPMFNTGRD